jgi:glutathione S-transferase
MTTPLQLCAFPTGEGMFNLSPFCTKAEILLRMAALDHDVVMPEDFTTFPKAKLPVLMDGDTMVEDSELIRLYLERKYGVRLDAGLTPVQKAIGHALCRMVEERTRYALLHARWHDDEGWTQTKAIFFTGAPAEIAEGARAEAQQTLHLNGLSRHSDEEIREFIRQDLAALSTILGADDWFFGSEPTHVDACIFSMLANFHASPVRTWTSAAVAEFPSLVAYVIRGLERWYPAAAAQIRAA